MKKREREKKKRKREKEKKRKREKEKKKRRARARLLRSALGFSWVGYDADAGDEVKGHGGHHNY